MSDLYGKNTPELEKLFHQETELVGERVIVLRSMRSALIFLIHCLENDFPGNSKIFLPKEIIALRNLRNDLDSEIGITMDLQRKEKVIPQTPQWFTLQTDFLVSSIFDTSFMMQQLLYLFRDLNQADPNSGKKIVDVLKDDYNHRFQRRIDYLSGKDTIIKETK